MITKSVNLISGGKTSCYMAIHYPTDLYVFALVTTKDTNAKLKDKGVEFEIKKRIPNFIASRELDQTLINVLNLEQKIGKPIKWLASHLTYDDITSNYLPHKLSRICTYNLKVLPIFEYLYYTLGIETSYTNIGFRYDELKRKTKLMKKCNVAYSAKVPILCRLENKRQVHRLIEYRVPFFPLIEDRVYNVDVIEYWNKQNWQFPEISNCDFCFFHTPNQLREQAKMYPDRLLWWQEQESNLGRTFITGKSYSEIINDVTYNSTNNSSCSCTD